MENAQIFKGSLLSICSESPTLMSFYLPGLQVDVYVCAQFWKSLLLNIENSDESQEEEG